MLFAYGRIPTRDCDFIKLYHKVLWNMMIVLLCGNDVCDISDMETVRILLRLHCRTGYRTITKILKRTTAEKKKKRSYDEKLDIEWTDTFYVIMKRILTSIPMYVGRM